tara:strand:- start:382 stop:618 length:237 start_codon:yes stop_codon:yes gene_type:complete
MAQPRFSSSSGLSADDLSRLSGLDLLRLLDVEHGAAGWQRPEQAEFASVTLVVELPSALFALLQQVLGRPPLSDNPCS